MTKTQAAYFRNRSLCRMAAILTSQFETVWLLSLHYTPGAPVPYTLADRQYRTLMDRARRLAVGPFRYMKVTEYGTGAASTVTAYRLFLDLPAEICQEIAGRWFMGAATIEHLDRQQIADFVDDLMARLAGGAGTGRKIWATSIGLAQHYH